MREQTLRILRLTETEDTAKLAKTTLIEDIKSEEVRELIDALYKAPDPLQNKVATILNAMFTQQRVTFLLSKRLANNLVLEDENHNFKGVNSETYKLMVYKLLTGWKFFARLREPTKKQAGVLKLVDNGLLDMMFKLKAKEYYELQEVVTLEFYDGYEEDGSTEEPESKAVKPFAEYIKEDKWEVKTVDVSNAVLTKEIIEEAAQKAIDDFGTIKEEKKDEPRKIFE